MVDGNKKHLNNSNNKSKLNCYRWFQVTMVVRREGNKFFSVQVTPVSEVKINFRFILMLKNYFEPCANSQWCQHLVPFKANLGVMWDLSVSPFSRNPS